MPRIDVHGTTLAYDDVGSGVPVVFLGRDVFAEQVARFGEEYRAVAFDPRNGTADDAVGLVMALGLAPCHVVGAGTGGLVALRLAARHGRLVRSAAVVSCAEDEGVLGELVGMAVPLLVLSGGEERGDFAERVADTATNARHVVLRGLLAGSAHPATVHTHLTDHLQAT